MIWINSRERMPINGQRVWYYGECIGVWRGRFVIDKSDRAKELTEKFGVPNTTFHCEDSPGVCDTDDAPYWMPYEEGSEKPMPPNSGTTDDHMDLWKKPYATVSWCAEDVFNNLRLEMCPPKVLCQFLERIEEGLQNAMIDAAVNRMRAEWRMFREEQEANGESVRVL